MAPECPAHVSIDWIPADGRRGSQRGPGRQRFMKVYRQEESAGARWRRYGQPCPPR